MWFIGVEVEKETSAPPPKKNPGSAPVVTFKLHMKATNHPIDSTKSMHAQHFVWFTIDLRDDCRFDIGHFRASRIITKCVYI